MCSSLQGSSTVEVRANYEDQVHHPRYWSYARRFQADRTPNSPAWNQWEWRDGNSAQQQMMMSTGAREGRQALSQRRILHFYRTSVLAAHTLTRSVHAVVYAPAVSQCTSVKNVVSICPCTWEASSRPGKVAQSPYPYEPAGGPHMCWTCQREATGNGNATKKDKAECTYIYQPVERDEMVHKQKEVVLTKVPLLYAR